MTQRQEEETDKQARCPGTQCTPTECADKLEDWVMCVSQQLGTGHFKRDSKNISFKGIQPVPS